jgi:ABC-type branched-subunit amino acid transport system ATPase component/ABC-type branched-subunit amino acid transport system permease subunit
MSRWRRAASHPLLILGVVLVILPFATSSLGSTTGLATEVVIYALYGIAFNLMLGYTGLVSFGASLFFGTGSYIATLTALHISQNIFLGLALAVLLTIVLSLLLGLLILRRRGIYFALLTLAFTQLFYEIAFHWTSVTGGENGLQGVLRDTFASAGAFYAFTAVIVMVSAAVMLRIVHSPFGRVLQVIRDSERRAQCMGYDPRRYKLGVFVVSSTFIGLAGGLLAFLIRGAYADNLNWVHAGDPVLMTVLGGMHHFLGPMWGALIYINLQDRLSAVTEHWWLFFGALLMAVVLLSPEGLSGIYTRLRGSRLWGLTLTPIPPCLHLLPDLHAGRGFVSGEEPILTVHGLIMRFGRVVAADDVNVSIMPGKIHSLIGPNGAGKTTFFNMLTGLLPPDSGTVLFKGQDITKMPVHERFTLGMSRSFQIVSVPQNLTVFEAIRVAVQARARGRASIWRDAYSLDGVCEKTWTLLHMVGLEQRAGSVTISLPHGEQRLLDIAVTLAGEPAVLLLDEPLAGLADADRERIATLLTRLAGHYTIVLVEHDIDRVIALSDRITVLHEGRVIAEGAPQEVVNQPAVMEAYLGKETAREDAATRAREAAPAPPSPILRVRDVGAGYSGSHVLDGLSLEVGEGETVALLGRNGVGKTTTLYTLIGTVKANRGRIEFDGQDITRLPAHRVNQLGLSIVPQGRRIFPNLTVADNLLIARRPGGWSLDAVFELFPKLGILQSSLGDHLSGGELQMLAIARALMAPTRLMLLDEPFEGLAPAIVDEVMRAVAKLRGQTAILLVEQRVQLALQMVDRVYVMVNGRIAFEGAPGQLLADKKRQVELLGV